jgi:integrase
MDTRVLIKMAGADDLFYSNKPRRYGGEHSQADTPVRHLSDGQLHSLMSLYQQLPTGREKDCLDLFFFSFHACGLRVSDIITLEWRHLDLQRRILSKVMVKTKSLLTIPLSDAALEILGRWKRRNRRFVFNLLIESFDLSADAALCRAIDSRNRSIRGVLNRIGKQIGLPFPLGMHVARHSFAVKALNSGGYGKGLCGISNSHSFAGSSRASVFYCLDSQTRWPLFLLGRGDFR